MTNKTRAEEWCSKIASHAFETDGEDITGIKNLVRKSEEEARNDAVKTYKMLIDDIKYSLKNPCCTPTLGMKHDATEIVDSIRELIEDFEALKTNEKEK